MADNSDQHAEVRVLLTATQIRRTVGELGRRISQDYEGRQPLLIGVLKGTLCFLADLIREISLDIEIDLVAVSSYDGREQVSMRVTKTLDSDISERDVILVEDIVDTGATLDYLLGYLRAYRPATLRVYALLSKPSRRVMEAPIEYMGFEIPDEFVVGYGLDYRQRYRNLPFIGVLRANS